jgi:nitrogen fixation protein NifU and related proteins
MTDRTALESVYQELILRHYRSSKHRGDLDAPDAVIPMRNPVCGDDILLQVRIEDDRVEEIRFSGHGCAISQAAASMMSEKVVGRSWEEIHALAARFREMLGGDAEAAKDRALGDMRALAGVSKLPRRVKCAMLAWDALEEAEKKISSG